MDTGPELKLFGNPVGCISSMQPFEKRDIIYRYIIEYVIRTVYRLTRTRKYIIKHFCSFDHNFTFLIKLGYIIPFFINGFTTCTW